MEEKYLYPAFPIPHIGGGNDYVEYMLSAVLGSWGYVIRHINRDLSLFAYAGKDGEKNSAIQLQLCPSEEYLKSCAALPPRIHDLRLRYYKNTDGLFDPPIVIRAYTFY